MTLEIPGYYYDEEKKRYFKIEDNRTAPAEASWSSGNVKRRKIESKKAEMKREREARDAGRVKKAAGVWREPLLGGCFFGREIGLGLGWGSSLGTERRRGEMMEDFRRESWTLGLREKGTLRLWPERNDHGGDVTHMYIGGEEAGGNSGLGAAYVVTNSEELRSTYIPRDDRDEINFGEATFRYPRTNLSPHREAIHMPFVTSLNYHVPSHKVLLTSWQRGRDAAIAYFSPRLSDVDAGEVQPAWRLGEVTPLIQIRSTRSNTHRDGAINTLRPAPASSPLTAVAGANAGILMLQGDNLTWMNWSPPDHTRFRGPKTADIFTLDFLAQNPAHVILAAGRSKDIAVLDTRLKQHSGAASYIRHTSSVAHARSVGDYGVLAAGPESAMAIYDIRFGSHNTDSHLKLHGKKHKPQPLPVVTFPEYKNEAHVLGIGFDVSDSKGGGLGIVAAAQDDGTVALFSLASGKKLRSKAADGMRRGGVNAGAVRVIQTMMFQTLPGDTHPSLFVGEGLAIKKYSFGMSYSKKGGLFLEDED